MTRQSFQPNPLAFQSFQTSSSTNNRYQGRRPQRTARFLSFSDIADASSSSSINLPSLLTAANDVSTATTTTFEPIMPDTTALAGFASIVLVCIVAGWVWANQVVPVSRTKLALSKKNGPIKEYLDELRASAVVTEQEQSMSEAADKYLETDDNTITETIQSQSAASNTDSSQSTTTPTSSNDDRSLERWLFTDWLEKPASQGGRQKEPALPVLKDAKWNSGDNPVLAATALIMGGVIMTAVVERLTSLVE